jgi:hypothetical protein
MNSETMLLHRAGPAVVATILAGAALVFGAGDSQSRSEVGRYAIYSCTLHIDVTTKDTEEPIILRLDTVTGNAWYLESRMLTFTASWAGPDGKGSTQLIGWTPVAQNYYTEMNQVTKSLTNRPAGNIKQSNP